MRPGHRLQILKEFTMKRFHVHLNVDQLDSSNRFYTTLFGVEPSVLKSD